MAFEFKFNLNSSEQPPSFILSHGEDAVKMRCTILKREEKVGHAKDFLREKGWCEKGSVHEKRKDKKRKEKKQKGRRVFLGVP